MRRGQTPELVSTSVITNCASQQCNSIATPNLRALLVEALGQVSRCNGCCRLALGAAPAIEELIELGAIGRGAVHVSAERRVSIVVHGHAACQTFGPGAILRHSHLLGPAQGAASASFLWASVLEWRLAVDGRARDPIASVHRASSARRIHGVLGLQQACGRHNERRDEPGELHWYKAHRLSCRSLE